MGKFVATWAALGVTLSTATQLRLYGLPVGVSEAILTAWILFVIFLILRGAPFAIPRIFLGVTGYWLISIVLLCFGMIVAVHTREFRLSVAAHDGLAFAYVGLVASLLTLSFYDRVGFEYHLHLARATFLFHSWSAVLLLVLASLTPSVGPISFWYAGVRFSGWAANPNQMALAMVATPFLGWYLCQRSSSLVRKLGYLLGIGFCAAVGITTQSDGLRVAWAAALCVAGGFLWYRVTARGRSSWLYISHVIIPVLVLVVAVSYGGAVVEYLSRISEGTYAEGDQGAKRFTLWLNGLAAIAHSPLVGFGPGPFSGLTGPLEGEEAHNSLIDWGMSTGGIGMLLHLALWGWCLWRAIRARSGALLGMSVAIITFSLFSYMLRHPDYWLMLILTLSLTERGARVGLRQAPGLAAPGPAAPSALQTHRSKLRIQQPKIG
jgi:O-antigen ligase